MSQLLERMIRAAKLDVNLYEEVEADEGAMVQALTVVVISSVAAGIGNVSEGGWSGVFVGTIGALIGWLVWAYLTYLIGTKILPESQTSSNAGELLRTIGFSSSPGVIRILALIPVLRSLVFFISSVWMLIAMVIAVRQALDYSATWRAIVVCLIGWVIQMIILMLVFSVLAVSITGF
jgi:hypothetical protein